MTDARPRRPLALGALAAAGLVLAARGTTEARQPAARTPTHEGGGAAVLQGELDALAADGVAADHPKARMLQDDLADLEAGMDEPVVPEPGVDVAARIAAGARGTGVIDDAGVDDGPVDCEPLPAGLLTPAEIEGARCSSRVQRDGSRLYVAERPDGTRHVVRFGVDGTVARQP